MIKSIKVEAEGFQKEKTWTRYVCTEGEDFCVFDVETRKVSLLCFFLRFHRRRLRYTNKKIRTDNV